ncbi:MAG: FeoA family protein [Candidatus Omnitrophica bacterium]|nr:FeoA family protein [Candidatus Omnitrophota bacterium]
MTTKPSRPAVALTTLGSGGKGNIAYLQTKNKAQMQKLLSIGAIPGVHITLMQKFPSYVFKIGHSQFAVDKELAQGIFVRVPVPK